MNIDISHEYCFTNALSLQEHKLASSQASPVFYLPFVSPFFASLPLLSGRLAKNGEGLGTFIT